MDALARVEPVARPLLRAVDDALVAQGAPAEHAIWPLLRRVRATPADAVDHFADAEPQLLGGLADALRAEADGHGGVRVPAEGWEGAAGSAYAVRAEALAAQLHGPDGVAARLRATASYVDDVGGWQRRARDRVAMALADVLGSVQAASLRGITNALPAGAADIGARVLTAIAECLDEGERLAQDWTGRLDEIAFRAPVEPDPTTEARIYLSH